MSDPLLPDNLRALIRSSVTSIWSLELLLLLKRSVDRAWSLEELVREMRGSAPMIGDLLVVLERSGLITRDGAGFRYQPASAALQRDMDELERLSAERPLAVRQAILAAPHDRIQVFADAFRIKRS